MVRRLPSKHKNTAVAHERDSGGLAKLAALLVCGLLLAGGFVYAGGRHFAALRMGYETERLRSQLETAREEQRRLVLEREAAASPARLERAARQLGMQPMLPSQIDPVKLLSHEVPATEPPQNQSAAPSKPGRKAEKKIPVPKNPR